MPALKSFSLLLSLSIGISSLSGCTLAMGALTAADEARAKQASYLEPSELSEILPGTPLLVHGEDGQILQGEYVEVRSDVISSLVVVDEGLEIAIPLRDVERIQRVRKKHSVRSAMIFGGVIDAAVLAVVLMKGIPVDVTVYQNGRQL